jgi:hypothetical protein
MNQQLQALTKIAIGEKMAHFKASLAACNVSSDCQDQILSTLASYEDTVSETFELFKTPWRIKRYMEKNFSLVLPEEIALGEGSFQYIPIVKLLKKLTADKTFKKYRETKKKQREDFLEDVEDGLLFKNSSFFRDNPAALK